MELEGQTVCRGPAHVTELVTQKRVQNEAGSSATRHEHQPFREKELIPFLSKVIAAGENAGALGGFLSGSGSTICCVAEMDEGGKMKDEEIGAAMLAASGNAGARIVITQADNNGTAVIP